MSRKTVAAARALIDDVLARHPNEELTCPLMRTLAESLPTEKTRHCYIGAPEAYSLDHVAHFVNKALGDTCYLVGSATETRDFRDVDIRMIFDDEKWKKLFGDVHGGPSFFWSLLCVSVSEYMSTRTGLKIDFQVQKRSNVNKFEWDKIRNPIGLFYSQDSDPEWKKRSE